MADSNPTTQLVDSRIVSLLGLQDDLELSHEDYFRSLKEAALAARMSDGKFSSEEVSLITEELKRVRKEDKNIKFQTEKKKVKAKPKTQKVSNKNTKKPPKSTTPRANTKVTALSTFVQKQQQSPATEAPSASPPQATPTVPLLPQPKKKTVEVKEKKQKIKKEGCCEILGKKLTKIDSTLGSIFSTLKDQFSLRKKDSERERRGREKSGREDAENKLEKGSGIKEIVNTAKNLLSPFQDLFDRIKRFIVFTLLGKAFTMFMDWMKDPKNRQTFNTIVKFLTDHWVLIVGSYLLFGTRLGGFVRSVSKLVVKLAVRAVVATGKLIAVLAKSKWGRVALAAGAVTAGAVAISQSGKKKDDKQDVESYAKGGIIGGLGKALKFTPLGMAFEAGKHGAKAVGKGAKAVGKVASGATDFLGKGLKKSLDIASLPLTIGFKGLAGASEFLMNGLKSLDLFKLLAGPIQSITKKGGDKDPKLQAAGGIPGLIGLIVQKTSEGVGKNVKDSKKSKKEEGKDKGAGYAKGGLVNPLPMGLMGAASAVPGLGALAPFAPLLSPLLQSKKIGGGHGLPVSGAGKDDRLLKLRTGDAVLTEKDQKQLSTGNFLEKLGGPMGAMASYFGGKGSGEETVVAAKKGEAVVTQEDQLNIFEKTGISIPSLLSGRKANKVSSDRLKTQSGKRLPGFFNGGIVEGFASGGIVGKDAGYANTRYKELLQTTKKGTIDSYNKKHGEGAYEKKLLAKLNTIHTPKKSKPPKVKTESAYVKNLKAQAAKNAGKSRSTLSVNGIRIPGGGALAQQLQGMQAPKLTAPKVNAKIDPNAVAGSIQSTIMSTYKKLGAKTTTDQQLNAEWNKKALEKQRPWWDKAGLFGGGSRVVQNEAAARNKRKENKSKIDDSRKAFGDIFENPDLKNPLHEKVAFGDMTYEQFKKVYSAKQSTTPAKGTPDKSKFAGARDAAHAKAKKITGESKQGFGIGSSLQKVGSSIGGWMQGRFNQVSKDVKTSKPKATPFTGVKSSDFYQANSQAKEKSLSKLTSQKRLDALSKEGGGIKTGRGKRFTAENLAKKKEWQGRGGTLGGIKRGFQSFFGGADAQIKNLKSDKASAARVRQAGAASIGRYYSSSDGKYYKDYAAAESARKVRAAAPKPAAPKPAFSKVAAPKPAFPKPAFPKPAAPKPAAPKPAAPKPKGIVKKKEGGGLVEKGIGEQLRSLRGLRSDSLERQGETNSAYGLRGFNLQKAFKNFNTNDIFKKSKYSLNLNDSFKNYFDKSKNTNKQKKPNPFGPNLGLNLKPIKTNYQLSKTSKNKDLTKIAFNPNTNLNNQKPKRQSISDSLKELRAMRARSLDRQGDTLGALGVRASNYNLPKIDASKLKVDPKKAYGSNLNFATPPVKELPKFDLSKVSSNVTTSFKPTPSAPLAAPPPPKIDTATNLPVKTTTDAPPPPKIDTSAIQKKAGGGIINKVKSGIGGFFKSKEPIKKRDVVKKVAGKAVSKGDDIKSNLEKITNKSKEKKKGFWGGIYDTVSSINTGVNTAKAFAKKINPIKTAKNAANFIGGNIKNVANVVSKKGSSVLSSVAQNPKMLKVSGALGKFGGRMVPGLGVAASAADAAARAERGDKWGAALAGLGAGAGATTIATSGAAATGAGAVIPAAAEAVSMGADVALLGKDIWDIMSSKENTASPQKNKVELSKIQSKSSKDLTTSKVNMMQGGGIVKLQGGGELKSPAISSAPLPPTIDPATNLPVVMTNDAPSVPPIKPIQPKPSTPLAPIKKSVMQQQADELRAMRANSMERQGRTSEAYGQRAFGSKKDFSSFFTQGSVTENTGMNMPGGTADRQLTALQPGEYVIPKQTVNSLGGASFFDNMVSKTDSDSNPAKLGAKSKSNVGGGIKPYPINNSKKPQVTNLGSAKEARSGAQRSQGSPPNGASKEVFFEALCQEGSAPSERQRIMDLLGANS